MPHLRQGNLVVEGQGFVLSACRWQSFYWLFILLDNHWQSFGQRYLDVKFDLLAGICFYVLFVVWSVLF